MKVAEIEKELVEQGGLENYQVASRTGQRGDRGGDSSRVLVEWLHGEIRARKDGSRATTRDGDVDDNAAQPAPSNESIEPLRILEVGALSTRNALNILEVTEVKRIDLRSSEDGIEEVDFMNLTVEEQGYDVLSLSLVLNYVPDAKARGEMLKRTTLFLRKPPPPLPQTAVEDSDFSKTLPSLFLVLPSSCVENSRYLTPDHLTMMLNSLGYSQLHSKTTRKLHYSLWRYDGLPAKKAWAKNGGQTVFRKKEIKTGGGRNNFCIILG